MGQGGYIFAEWASVAKEYPEYQRAFAALESKVITDAVADWAPRGNGFLTPRADQFGRTSILPELFNDFSGTVMAHWRQALTSVGHQTLITGSQSGNTIPREFKIAWMGIAFPNEQQNISEIKFQIGDRKYGRINLEEMHGYSAPAIIFEEGILVDDVQSFDLYGYVEGPLPIDHQARSIIYQRIVLLGAAYYKYIDKVLGNTGAAIVN